MLIDNTTPKDNVRVVAAIDSGGIAHYEIIRGKYDQFAYIAYLKRLRTKLGSRKHVALLFDGLSLHKTSRVYATLICEFGWLPLLNVAYQPNSNPIEGFFGVIKRDYRLMVTSEHVRRQKVEQERLLKKVELVEEIFEKYRARDNTALISGAERHIEKLADKKFKRE